jgi:hypothetical protein
LFTCFIIVYIIPDDINKTVMKIYYV